MAPDTDTLNCVLLALKAGEQPELVLSLVQHMKTVSKAPQLHNLGTALVHSGLQGGNDRLAASFRAISLQTCGLL